MTSEEKYLKSAVNLMGSVDLNFSTGSNINIWPKVKNVFLNLDGNNQDVWVEKLLEEKKKGSFKEAILLCDSATGSKWFQKLFSHPICFISSPQPYKVLVYLGDYPGEFAKEFKIYGVVV
jgi:hypothetical protein